jgi:hypothetical protein
MTFVHEKCVFALQDSLQLIIRLCDFTQYVFF